GSSATTSSRVGVERNWVIGPVESGAARSDPQAFLAALDRIRFAPHSPRMRAFAALCSLLLLSGACRRAEQPVLQRDQAAAAQSSSDVPPRGVEPANTGAVPPPPDAGRKLEPMREPASTAEAPDGGTD